MKNIFISSTFIDMQAERDLVQERVLPALRDEARKYGDNVGVIDLRWGVDTSTLETEEGAAKVLQVCLDEIDRSHPYMLIFLGERYGTMMREDQIAKSVRGREDKYTTDDYVKSITALEVEYGALSEKYGELNHCVVCFREPVVHMLDGAEKALYAEHTEEGKRKLEALKERIKRDLGDDDRLITYSCTWDKSARQLVDFTSNGQPLENVLTNCFVEMFRDDWKEYESLSWKDKEQLAFRALMESKLRSFVGREELLEEYYQSVVNGTCPIILQGEVGSGKTAIMCKLVERLQKEGKNVFAFFSGAGSMSTNAESLVKQMVYYMENLLGVEAHFGEGNAFVEMEEGFEKGVLRYSDWMERLRELCYRLPEEKKVYVCIDALDQMYFDEHVEMLDFLIKGKGVQFVASCTNEFEVPMNAMEKRDVKSIPALNEMDAKVVAESILASYSRNAYVAIEQVILKKKSIGSPLYISLLIQRLNMMDAEELRKAMTEEEIVALGTGIIREMPDALEDATVSIIQNGIAKVSDNDDMLREVLGYLAVSRNGLRMQDLQGIFSLQNKDFPILDVTLLLSYLDSFFYVNEDGRIDFTHKVIRGGLLKEIDNRKYYEEGIKNYLFAVGVEDELTIKEGLYYARIFEEYAFAQKLIAYANDTMNKELFRAIKEEALADEGCFIVNALEVEGIDKKQSVSFFARSFHEVFETSRKEREIKLLIGRAVLENCERMYEDSKRGEDAIDLAECLFNIGVEKKADGNLLEAERDLWRAIQYYEMSAKEDIASVLGLVRCYIAYVMTLPSDKKEDVEEMYTRAFRIINTVQRDESISVIQVLSSLFINYGLFAMKKDELRTAHRCFEQALDYRKRIVEVLCTEEAQRDLYFAYEKRGVLYRSEGKMELAKADLNKSLKGREVIYSQNPSLRNLRELLNGYLNLGTVIMALEANEKDKTESYGYLSNALQCAEQLHEAENSGDSLKYLTIACHNIAIYYFAINDLENAMKYSKRAEMYVDKLCADYGNEESEMLQRGIYQICASICGQLGKSEEQQEYLEKVNVPIGESQEGDEGNQIEKAKLYMFKTQAEQEKGNYSKVIEYGEVMLGCIGEESLIPMSFEQLLLLFQAYCMMYNAYEELAEKEKMKDIGNKLAKCAREIKGRFPMVAEQFGIDEMLEELESDELKSETESNTLDGVGQEMKKAKEIYEKEDSVGNLKQLLEKYYEMGVLLCEKKRIDDADAYFKELFVVGEKEYERKKDSEYLQILIHYNDRLSQFYSERGLPFERARCIKRKLGYARLWKEDLQEKSEDLFDLFHKYTTMSRDLKKLGKMREALACCEKALKCVKQLYEERGGVLNLSFLASTYITNGNILRELEQTEDSLECYEKGIKCREELNEKRGSESSLKDLSISYNNMGNALKDLGQAREALSYYEKALKCKKDLYEKSGSEGSLRELSISYNNMGHAMLSLGQAREALSYYEKALKCAEELHEKSGSEGSLRDLSISYNNMGNVLYDLDRYEEAMDYFEKDMRGREELYRKNANDSNLSSLSVAYNNYGWILCELGRTGDAVEYLERALRYTEELHQKNPTKNTQLALVARWRNLARALQGANRLQEALEYGKKAVELDRELYSQDASDVAKGRVVKSFSIYAETLFADNQTEEAYKMYSEALEHCKSVCEKNDSIPNTRTYVKVLKGLYLCLFKMGQSAEAEEYLLLAKEEAKKLYERSGAEKDKKLLDALLSY